MELPDPQHAVLVLLAFVRRRIGALPCGADPSRPAELAPFGQIAKLVDGAAPVFAPTSYARARLLRQLHASGLLTEPEAEQAAELLQIAP